MARRGGSPRAKTSLGRVAVPVLGLLPRVLAIPVCLAGLVVGSYALLQPEVVRADDAWAVDRNGVWDDPANWLGGTVPDSIGVRVLFGPVTTAQRTITIQDSPNGQGNDDGVITVGELTFDSPFAYTLVGNQLLELDSFDGPALVRVLSGAEHAAHALGSGLDALRLAARDDIVFDVDSPAGLNIWKELMTTGVTATKIGRGPLTVRASADATWIVGEGTLKVFGSPTVTVNGGALDALEAQNPVTIIGPNGGGILAGTYSTEDRLRGDGALYKAGVHDLNIQAVQPRYSGTINVREGDLNLSAAATNPFPSVPSITVENRARLVLGKHDYAEMLIRLAAGGELMGFTEERLGFGSLVRGGNLILEEDAIVFQDSATESIRNLGSAADLWFGVGVALSQPLNLTVGNGTPWKGIVVDAQMPHGGVVRGTSDFSIRGSFAIGDRANGNRGLDIVSTGPRRTIAIDNASVYSDDADLSGVGRLVVSGQLTIHGSGALGLGPTQVPIIDLLRNSGIGAVSSTPTPEAGHFGVGANASTIHFRGGAGITLQSNTGGDINFGGNFFVDTPESVSIFASGGETRNRDSAQLQIQSLRVTADAQITLGSVDNKQPVIRGETNLGSHEVRIVTSGTGSPNVSALQGPLIGNGTLRILGINSGITRLDGNLSEFRGPDSQVIVETGTLRLGDDRAFDIEAGGPTIELQTHRLPSVLSYSANIDHGRKLSPDSTGELALRGRHTALSGVNGSNAFIGADGVATVARPGLEPGAEKTYRLGSTTANAVLRLDAGPTSPILTGDSNVVVDYSGAAFQSSSSQNTVEFLGPNNYTGSTTIKRGTLVLRAPEAIGHGVAAGPINVELGILELRDGGSLGTTGPITIKRALRIFSDGQREINRLPEETPILLRGGILAFNGSGAVGKPRERIGAVTLAERHSTIAITGEEAGARLEIGNLVRNPGATLAIEGLTKEPSPDAEPKEQIVFDNANALLANGILPWAGGVSPSASSASFVGYSAAGVVDYSGPLVRQLEGAGPTDNVSPIGPSAPLSRDTTINALHVTSVDLAGHVLNVGTVPINGVAIGALVGLGSIGSRDNPGFLTSGQSAFAPNSASPGELIIHRGTVVNPMGINAAIIDNAGPDGVFGNADDLPVALTISGNAVLNGVGNRYTGPTTIHGFVTASQPLGPGPVDIVGGNLRLVNDTSGVVMAPGVVTIKGGSLIGQAPGPNSFTPGELRIASLTVSSDPDSTSLVSNIVVNETLDVRGARVLLQGGKLVLEGRLLEDSTTAFVVSRSFEGTLIARTGEPVQTAATLEETSLGSAGTGTLLRYTGTMNAPNEGGLFAATGGKIVVEPAATLTSVFTPRHFLIGGDSTGVVEFANGFQLIRSFGQEDQPNVGVGKLQLTGGATWITNDSANLPNIDPAEMRNQDDYFGYIGLAWPGSTWRVASKAQSFNQKLEVLTSTRVVTDAHLTLTGESLLSFGANNVELSQPPVRMRSSTGALEKRGFAELRVDGRLSTMNTNVIDVREGGLVMNNRTVEGSGALDVRVHAGGRLAGGDAAGSTGQISGMIRIEARGRLAPGEGESTGILSAVGDFAGLDLRADAIFEPTLGGPLAGTLHDQLRIDGTVTLGDGAATGTAVLAPELNYAPALGDLFFLIDNDGADPISGHFQAPAGALLSEGAFFDLTSSADGLAYRFQIGYRGDTVGNLFSSPTGNDVVLRAVAIPEPASLGLLLAFSGIAAIAHIAGRRRKSCH